MKYLILFILCLLFMGCGHAKMKITEFDNNGDIISVNKISYFAVGTRDIKNVDVDLETGKAKIGSAKGTPEGLGLDSLFEGLKNFSEVAKKAALIK